MRKHSTYSKKVQFLSVIFLLVLCCAEYDLHAQLRYRVLFLGNSYTSENNLPQMIYDAAISAGDTLVFDQHSPGGYQLIDHTIDVTSQNKIRSGGWDYVVMQGQSQEPVMRSTEFSTGGSALYNQVKQFNPCAITMPFMTWGRKTGDTQNCPNFPILCTYQGMDTTIRNRYLSLTTSINGEVAPVSVVWNYLRQNHPNIELYQGDESHPSRAGSYAAACTFYAMLFKKDPALISFNAGLNASEALIIRNAVKVTVFDKLQLWDFKKPPVARFYYEIGPGNNEVFFRAISEGVRQTYFWDFGDGQTSTSANATHSYLANGTYTVSLTTTNCNLQGVHTNKSDTIIQFCNHTPSIYTRNAWLCKSDTIWTQAADSYKWFENGGPLSETKQYLKSFYQTHVGNLSVMTTINGCSELSRAFTKTPEWSGYYFDAMGDPCAGDTVAFAVLHTNNFLSGQEKIFWFKNGILLTKMTNEDTLFITSSGKYESKVINPNSKCPLDTTSYVIEYDCGPDEPVVGDPEEVFWTIFPNPTFESITVKFISPLMKDQIQIYNATGRLTKVLAVSRSLSVSLSLSDLPSGVYFMRLKNNKQRALKFIKL